MDHRAEGGDVIEEMRKRNSGCEEQGKVRKEANGDGIGRVHVAKRPQVTSQSRQILGSWL